MRIAKHRLGVGEGTDDKVKKKNHTGEPEVYYSLISYEVEET